MVYTSLEDEVCVTEVMNFSSLLVESPSGIP